MNQLKIIVALSLLGVACMTTTVSSRSGFAGTAFAEGGAVALMPQTLPKPPHRPRPTKAAPSTDAVFLG